jgi:protein-disulfide isomerase
MARFCRKCGATLADGSRFCESCGTAVGAAMPETRALPSAWPAPSAAGPPPSTSAESGRWIWLIVALIALFGLLFVGGVVLFVVLARDSAATTVVSPPPFVPPPIAAPVPPPPTTPDAPAPAPAEEVFRVPIGDSPQRGRADALVTIVEFADFQCPFCKRVRETLGQLERDRGDRIRIVFKHNPLPFHPNAMPAAEASLAAEAQGKFWQMEEVLFENQTALGRADLERYAARIGLDLGRFRRDLDGHAHRARIEADQRLASDLGARGTPTFFVNGRLLRGAQPFESFALVVDREAERARALVARGTSPALVYDELTRDGRTGPAPIEEPDADRVYPIVSDPRAPSRGSPGAAVTLIEFTDFQCPFCSRVVPTLAQLEQAYAGRVRIEFRHYPLPFHQNARLAHEAAAEAHAQGRFWPYHDLLFAHQDALARPDLERYAAEAGLDVARFRAALDDHRHAATVQADIDAVTRAGARIGTPSFFLRGKLLQGARPFEDFRAAIDTALATR